MSTRFRLVTLQSNHILITHKIDGSLESASQDTDRQESDTLFLAGDNGYIDFFRGTNWRWRIVLYINGLDELLGPSSVENGLYFLVDADISASKITLVFENC